MGETNSVCVARRSAGTSTAKILSLPKYDPFWAKAQELGVAVVMHPGGADNILKEGALRRTRRSRQHHRQPARNHLLPLAN
jgi:predicted TIM-barrel fold metal-dependent hydrolase